MTNLMTNLMANLMADSMNNPQIKTKAKTFTMNKKWDANCDFGFAVLETISLKFWFLSIY